MLSSYSFRKPLRVHIGSEVAKRRKEFQYVASKYLGSPGKVSSMASISRDVLAVEIGTDIKHINNLENNYQKVSLPVLIKVCWVLGCTPNDLFIRYLQPFEETL